MLRGKIFNLRKISANLYAFEAQRNYEATINVGIEKFVHRIVLKKCQLFFFFLLFLSPLSHIWKSKRGLSPIPVYI